MESTTIIVPSSSASSVASNDGPIELSSDADSGGGATNTRKKRRLTSSSVVSNHNPVVLPSDDVVLDKTARKKRVAAEPKRQRMVAAEPVGPIYTCWGFGDEHKILMELAAGRRETGRVPTPSELFRILQDKDVLDRTNVTRKVISSKYYSLKNKFISDIKKGGGPDQEVYELCKEVWPPEELRKEGKLI